MICRSHLWAVMLKTIFFWCPNAYYNTIIEKVPKTNQKMHVNPSDYKLCCKPIPIFFKIWLCSDLTLTFDLDFDLKWHWPYAYHVKHVLKHRIRHKNHPNRLQDPNYMDICMFHLPLREHHILVSSHCVFWSVGHIYRLWYLRLSFSNVRMYTITENVPKTKEKILQLNEGIPGTIICTYYTSRNYLFFFYYNSI